MEVIERYKVIVDLYIASAHHFTQLSTAALVLSVVFSERVLGAKGTIRADSLLIAAWVAFLSTIGFGAMYEYLAIHYLGQWFGLPLRSSVFPQYLERNPGVLYGFMLVSFFSGAALFATSAARALRARSG